MVDRLSAFLKNKGIKTWKDDEGGITGNILEDMANAVQHAALMIVLISEAYCISANCRREVEYGANLDKNMIVVKLEPKLDLVGKGSISLILGSKLYFTFQICLDSCVVIESLILIVTVIIKFYI